MTKVIPFGEGQEKSGAGMDERNLQNDRGVRLFETCNGKDL